MKYIYALTSTPKDNYYEQFLLSSTSLRLFDPQADIILVCDLHTKENLIEKRSEYEKIVTKTITIEAPSSMLQIEISRFVKTSLRNTIKGDFLYIDCDTIITENLTSATLSLKEKNIHFGACLDNHVLLDKHSNRQRFIDGDKKLGFSSCQSNRQYNGGVIFCADTPEGNKIFNRWHELWLFSKSKKIVRDMPSLNMATYENLPDFTEIDGTWNCQISFNGLPFLANSKIIHYFATNTLMNKSPFLLANENIFLEIKESGQIPDYALDLLKNPKSAFETESRIIAGEDILNVINSNFFKIFFITAKKLPALFKFIDWLCSKLKNIAKLFIVNISRKKSGGVTQYN